VILQDNASALAQLGNSGTAQQQQWVVHGAHDSANGPVSTSHKAAASHWCQLITVWIPCQNDSCCLMYSSVWLCYLYIHSFTHAYSLVFVIGGSTLVLAL
jgi:hypothetical protein